MPYHHKSLADGRWAQMSLCEQMAHIGSEVSRACNWRRKDNWKQCEKSVSRALELIALSIDNTTAHSRMKEFTRLREVLLDYFYGENEFGSSDELWATYFCPFNVVVRRGR